MEIKEIIKDILRPSYREYLAFRNRGNAVECNICGRKFSRLRPVVGRHADGSTFIIPDHVGSCWLCNSYPRVRQLWYWLQTEYKLHDRQGISVLHVAPELPLFNKFRKNRQIDYQCIDKHTPGYSYPRYVKDGDICDLLFPDNSFDLIICNHVLEHVKEDSKAISELYRVCKPGGKAILMVPIDTDMAVTDEEKNDETLSPAEREKRFGQFDHVRMYGLDYFTRLTEVGFSVERPTCDSATVARYGLTPGEEVVVCTKKL